MGSFDNGITGEISVISLNAANNIGKKITHGKHSHSSDCLFAEESACSFWWELGIATVICECTFPWKTQLQAVLVLNASILRPASSKQPDALRTTLETSIIFTQHIHRVYVLIQALAHPFTDMYISCTWFKLKEHLESCWNRPLLQMAKKLRNRANQWCHILPCYRRGMSGTSSTHVGNSLGLGDANAGFKCCTSWIWRICHILQGFHLSNLECV